MATLEKDANPYTLDKAEIVEAGPVAADADTQDDELWDQTFASSPDTLSRLAARSRANREAGRTKRINE